MTRRHCQLAVVIINYKTPQLTIACLESLLPELGGLGNKVVIVDNASNDGSCEIIQSWIENQSVTEQVELISSTVNMGFSGGNNRGVRHVNAEYYLLLNSDTLVKKGAISSLLNAAGKDKAAGLISPRLEWPDALPQESCFRFHTAISELIASANTGVISKLFQSFIVAQPVCGENNYYDWTSFACVMIKSEVFKYTGLMDDGYFMYFEDVEFCYRAKRAGWKVLNVPYGHVVHLRGGSSPVKSQAKLRKRLPRYYYESRTRYFYQIYGQFGLLMANTLWMIGCGISLMRSIISASFVPNVSKYQWRDIWTNFFNPSKSYIHPDDYDKA